MIRRLQNDGQFSAGGEEARWKYIWRSIIDWKTWVGSESGVISKTNDSLTGVALIVILYTGANGPLYGFSLFLPSIINKLGSRLIIASFVK